MSQVQDLIALFDGVPLETRFTVRDIQHLGIGPYSRRIEDARHHYFPLGFVIVNGMQVRPGQNTLSWYFKASGADYPEEYERAAAAYAKWLARKDRVKVPEKSERQKNSEWFAATFHVQPKKAEPQPEPEWSLTP